MDNRQKFRLHTPLLMLLCYILQLSNKNITSKTPHLPYMDCRIPNICDLSLHDQPSYQPMGGLRLAGRRLI